MTNINILCVGKIKEKYLVDLINEYSKRISKFAKLNIIELADESNKLPETIVLEKESNKIIENIPHNSFLILLDIKGEMLGSVELANKINEISTYHSSNITFIIGGSMGVNEEVRKKVDYKLSFSKMTFPHQLMRGILLEQIYRSFKILNNEAYHK